MCLEEWLGQQVVERRLLDVHDDRVLASGEANLAVAVRLGHVGERDGLRGGHPTDGNVQADVPPAVGLVVNAHVVGLPLLGRPAHVVRILLAEAPPGAVEVDVDVVRLQAFPDGLCPLAVDEKAAPVFCLLSRRPWSWYSSTNPRITW